MKLLDQRPAAWLATGLAWRLGKQARRAGDVVTHRRWVVALAYAGLFLPLTLLYAGRRPLWSDEIYTVYISRMGGFQQIWEALQQGADLQPPLIYLTTRLAQSWFGAAEWAIRLPSALGFLMVGLCLMFFVARRTGVLWGFVAAMFLLLTGAFRYAVEARPYGLVMGFAGLALLCWQSAAGGRHRMLAASGLSASLILALCSNYYAVLLFVPLTLAEAVRNYQNRRIDRLMWASILIAASTILVFRPLLGRSLQALASSPTNIIRLSVVVEAYKSLLASSGVILALFFLLSLGVVFSLAGAAVQPGLPFPLHETVAAVGLMAIPVPALLIALTVTHRLVGHYMIALTIGAALIFVFAAHRITGGSKAAALATALVLSGIFAGHTMSLIKTTTLADAQPVRMDYRHPELPIVVGSGLGFVQAWYYASPELRSRLLFVNDRENAIRYLNNDQTNMSIAYEERFFHWPVQDFDRFRRTHRQFLLNWTREDSWMLPAYQALGARIELLDVAGDVYLFLVTDDHFTEARSKQN